MQMSILWSQRAKKQVKCNHRRTKHIGKYVPWGYE